MCSSGGSSSTYKKLEISELDSTAVLRYAITADRDNAAVTLVILIRLEYSTIDQRQNTSPVPGVGYIFSPPRRTRARFRTRFVCHGYIRFYIVERPSISSGSEAHLKTQRIVLYTSIFWDKSFKKLVSNNLIINIYYKYIFIHLQIICLKNAKTVLKKPKNKYFNKYILVSKHRPLFCSRKKMY